MNLDTIIYRGIRENIGKLSIGEKTATCTEREEAEILELINDVRNEWQDAFTKFEYAYEEELIDYYTYRMKACESRYAYFLSKAKELGLKGVK